MKTIINHLVQQFNNVHRGRNWFGQSYLVKLSDVDDSKFFERPQPDIHSIAEIICHGTAWRNDAVVKIRTAKGELTEISEFDWPVLDKLQERGWAEIYKEYEESIDAFIRALEDKDDEFLTTEYHDPEFGGSFPLSFTINGILQHDIYHLGQIGLVAKMLKH